MTNQTENTMEGMPETEQEEVQREEGKGISRKGEGVPSAFVAKRGSKEKGRGEDGRSEGVVMNTRKKTERD